MIGSLINFRQLLRQVFVSTGVLFFLAAISPGFALAQDGGAKNAHIRLLEIGRTAFIQGRKEEAVSAFTQVLRIDPNNVEANYRLSVIYFQSKRYELGMPLIKRAIDNSPENAVARLAYAKALDELGEYDEAAVEYKIILNLVDKDSPTAAKTLRALDLVEFRQAEKSKDRNVVAQVGDKILKKYPSDASLLHVVGSTYMRARLLNRAEQVYSHLVKVVPRSPLAEYYLAGVYEAKRNIDESEKHYRLAIKKGAPPELEKKAKLKLALIRGFQMQAKGDDELARQAFLDVQRLDPKNVLANKNIGALSHKAGQFANAIEAYKAVLEVLPDDVDTRYRLGVVYLDSQRYFEALPEFEIVARSDKTGRRITRIRTLLAGVDKKLGGKLGEIQETVNREREYREAIKRDPKDAEAYQALGRILLSQRRVKEAKEALLKSVKIDPVRGLAYALLGELAENDQDLDKAIDYYQKALGTVIDNYQAVDSIQKKLMMALGNRFFLRNEYEDAELAYIDVLEKYGPDRSVLWKLALVTNRQAKNDIAKEYYDQLLEIAPDYLTARYNLGLLYEQEEEEDLAIAEYRRITLSDIDNQRLKDMAANRIKMIKRMVNGLSYSVGYSISINDNTNSARVGKLAEYSSSTSATVTYNYKIKKGMRFSLNLSPSYSVSHIAQSDGFSLSVSPNLSFKWREKNWRVGMTRSTSSSVLRPEGRSSRSEVINASVSWPGEGSINYSSRFSYRGFGSTTNPFFDSNTYTGGISMSMVGKNQIPLSFGYNMTILQNRGTLGNDNAYVGHSVNGRLDYRLPGGLVGNVNSNMGLLMYTNPDSYSGYTKKRLTLTFGVGTGLSYRVNSSLSFWGNYNYTVQRSNLPVGFILTRDQVVVGAQSASLGAIARNSIGFGMSISL